MPSTAAFVRALAQQSGVRQKQAHKVFEAPPPTPEPLCARTIKSGGEEREALSKIVVRGQIADLLPAILGVEIDGGRIPTR